MEKNKNKIQSWAIKNTSKYFSVLLLVVFCFLLIPEADAYQKTKLNVDLMNDFVVEPGRTEIFVNPGETVNKTVSVTNRIDRRVNFILTTEDFKGSADPNTPLVLLGDEIGPYSLKNFINPEVDSFSLEPGEKITLTVQVTVPPDSEPGGFYGALIISNVPDRSSNNGGNSGADGQTRLTSRLGSLFLVRVNGPVEESGYVSDFKIIEPKTFYTKRPDGFEILFKNEGTVHLVPYGTIDIKNLFGKTVSILPVDAYAALPDAVRYRQVLWEDKGISIGRYKANLSLYKGYGDEFDEASVVFWVIPWKALLVALLIIILLSMAISFVTSKFEFKRKI